MRSSMADWVSVILPEETTGAGVWDWGEWSPA